MLAVIAVIILILVVVLKLNSGNESDKKWWEGDFQLWKYFHSDTRQFHVHIDKCRNPLLSGKLQLPKREYPGLIGANVFKGFNGLTHVELDEYTTRIGNETFMDCTNLEVVDTGEGVKIINDKAFMECRNLKKLTLGFRLKQIGYSSFAGCPNIEEIHSLNTTPPELYESSLADVDKKKCKLYVPLNAIDKYKSAYHWKDFDQIIAE